MEAPIVVVLVLDAVGLNTLHWLFSMFPGYTNPGMFPNLGRLGLGQLVDGRYRALFAPAERSAYFASIRQASASPDSVIGHREMVGRIDMRRYKLFPDGLPSEFVAALEKLTGCKFMFNRMAGGNNVVPQCGAEHESTGKIILYTSVCDPLGQVAANEAVVPPEELREIAEQALALAIRMGLRVTRFIARPYEGQPVNGRWRRTARRHDATLPIGNQPTLLEILRANDVYCAAVGKTGELVENPPGQPSKYHEWRHLNRESWLNPKLSPVFVHPGRADTNPYTFQGVMEAIACARVTHRPRGTWAFGNFVDLDSVFGHVKDVDAWMALVCLAQVDRMLGEIIGVLRNGDTLLVTADHGMAHHDDYGYHSLDELLFLAKRIGHDQDLGGLEFGQTPGLTQVGDLVAQLFGCAREFRESIIEIPA